MRETGYVSRIYANNISRIFCDKLRTCSNSFRLFAESVVEGGGGGGVVGGVPPLGQVQTGQDTGLAGHSRVDLVVGQHHGVYLNYTLFSYIVGLFYQPVSHHHFQIQL